MTPGWLLWPFVVLLMLVAQAIRRLLRWWYMPVVGALAGFVLQFIIGTYDLFASGNAVYHVTGDDAVDQQAEARQRAASVAFDVRWWHRWRSLGVARLLSDHWTTVPFPPLGPSKQQELTAFLHVGSAAGLTLGGLVLLVLFAYALAVSFLTTTKPFGEGARS